MIATLGFGLVIGILLGLLGGGGSILAVPALVYGVGVPVAAAIPMSLVVVGLSSAAALIPRLRGGQVRWPIAGIFGATGAAAAFAGAAVNRLLEPRLVLAGFALLMIAAGIRMLTSTDSVFPIELGGEPVRAGDRAVRGLPPREVARRRGRAGQDGPLTGWRASHSVRSSASSR